MIFAVNTHLGKSRIQEIVEHLVVLAFPAADDRREDYDIAFLEGSITRPADLPRVQKIRDTAKICVAMGACATSGGIGGGVVAMTCYFFFRPPKLVCGTSFAMLS